MEKKDEASDIMDTQGHCMRTQLCQTLLKFLDVKTLLSLSGMVVFIVLSLNGTLDVESILIIITMIFQSYFTYKAGKQTTT